MKNKFMKCMFSLSLLTPVVILPFLKTSTSITSPEISNINFDSSNNNVSNTNKVLDNMLTPIHVTGKDKLVWLIFSEGFLESDQQAFVTFLKNAMKDIFKIEPMNKLSNLINVYAVNTISKTRWNGSVSQQTAFDVRAMGMDAYLGPNGLSNLQYITDQLKSNYFGDNVRFVEKTIFVGTEKDIFRSYNLGDDHTLLCAQKGESFVKYKLLHEAAHAMGHLQDEYGSTMNGKYPNAAPNLEWAHNNWGEFLGYKWQHKTNLDTYEERVVENYKVGPSKYLSYDKKKYSCLMEFHPRTDASFCAVCQFYLFSKINEKAKNFYDWFFLTPYISHDTATSTTNFMTVYRNYTNETKNVRVEVQINESGNKISKDFVVQPNDKPLKLDFSEKTTNVSPSYQYQYKIIDTKTNKILSTSHESEQLKLNVEYQDEAGNKIDEKISPMDYIVPLNKGDDHKLDLPIIPGYKFIGNESDLSIKNIQSDKTVILKFKKLNFKEINLTLKNEQNNNNVLTTKKVKVYEGEPFVPTNLDFIVNYGTGWYAAIKQEDIKPYSYEQINDTNNTINYYLTEMGPFIEYIGKPFYKVGEKPEHEKYDLFKITRANGKVGFDGVFWVDWYVDWNTPGTYKLTPRIEDKFIYYDQNKEIIRVLEKSFDIKIVADDGSITPPEPTDPEQPPVDPVEPEQPTEPEKPPVDPTPPTNPDTPTEPEKPSQNEEVNSSLEVIINIKNDVKNNYQVILDINDKFNAWSSADKQTFLTELSKNNINFNDLVSESQKYLNNNSVNNSNDKKLLIYILIPIVALIIILAISILSIVFIRKKKNH